MTRMVETFDDHQRRSIEMLDDSMRALAAGMTTGELVALFTTMLKKHGFDRWFRRPRVSLASKKLSPGDLVTIELAPATATGFGSVGASTVFGESDATGLVCTAREVCLATAGYASSLKCEGELFYYARSYARSRQMDLGPCRSIGYRCIPPWGGLSPGYPRSARVASWLSRHQIHKLNPRRMRGFYALRPPVSDGKRVAAFQEMIFVDEDGRRVMGRESLEDIGSVEGMR
jgi:hypothetical protein